jgi:hypothetical protein
LVAGLKWVMGDWAERVAATSIAAAVNVFSIERAAPQGTGHHSIA